MSARFLLDTNALTEPARAAPDRGFARQFELHRQSLAIPSPALHEALYGLFRMPPGRHRDQVDDYLHNVLLPTVEVLPYDDEAARWHAAERARLEAAGTPVSFADGQVAAVAARFDITLVTNNQRHFSRFQGIRVLNWMSDARSPA